VVITEGVETKDVMLTLPLPHEDKPIKTKLNEQYDDLVAKLIAKNQDVTKELIADDIALHSLEGDYLEFASDSVTSHILTLDDAIVANCGHIVFNPDPISVNAGGKDLEVTAQVLGPDNTSIPGRRIDYSIKDPSIAGVKGNADGSVLTLTGLTSGTTYLMARSGPVKDSSEITVTQLVRSLEVTPAELTVKLNHTATLTAVAKDQAGKTISPAPSISWTTAGGASLSASAGASVSIKGVTIGGPWIVSAESGGVSGFASVTVVPDDDDPKPPDVTRPTITGTLTGPVVLLHVFHDPRFVTLTLNATVSDAGGLQQIFNFACFIPELGGPLDDHPTTISWSCDYVFPITSFLFKGVYTANVEIEAVDVAGNRTRGGVEGWSFTICDCPENAGPFE
jgi:hypothetical protein